MFNSFFATQSRTLQKHPRRVQILQLVLNTFSSPNLSAAQAARQSKSRTRPGCVKNGRYGTVKNLLEEAGGENRAPLTAAGACL